MTEQLTREEAGMVSQTIKIISEQMNVSYGRAKEMCLAPLAVLAVEGRPKAEEEALAALRSLKSAGPGAMCEECGHFAGRHADNAGEDKEKCHFPYTGPPCGCEGMVWQGYRFVMQIGSGPAHIKEKV